MKQEVHSMMILRVWSWIDSIDQDHGPISPNKTIANWMKALSMLIWLANILNWKLR